MDVLEKDLNSMLKAGGCTERQRAAVLNPLIHALADAATGPYVAHVVLRQDAGNKPWERIEFAHKKAAWLVERASAATGRKFRHLQEVLDALDAGEAPALAAWAAGGDIKKRLWCARHWPRTPLPPSSGQASRGGG